jgi:hypothetical protein
MGGSMSGIAVIDLDDDRFAVGQPVPRAPATAERVWRAIRDDRA